MAYTSSETLFTAWAAWFAYAILLALDNDFQCMRCGAVSNEPIFDGVVVAFSKTQILPSLRPPTVQHANSPVRNSCLVKDKNPIKNAQLRKNILRVINGPTLIIKEPLSVNTVATYVSSDESDNLGE
ncbi:hypothetical protein H0H92_006213 [Tricholoma furcatifolium]|nr:hypothetical protein H0H92_006213 [Tricholoma furcatifolium]